MQISVTFNRGKPNQKIVDGLLLEMKGNLCEEQSFRGGKRTYAQSYNISLFDGNMNCKIENVLETDIILELETE